MKKVSVILRTFPEAMEAGTARLVGTDAGRIVDKT